MTYGKYDPQTVTFAARMLRQQIILVGTLSALAFFIFTLPLGDWHIPRKHYLPLHTWMEFMSILVGFLVFAVVWHTPKQEVSGSHVLIAVALFAAGGLDFGHALSFRDMLDFITPSSSDKSIGFWLSARLMVALTMLGVSFYPQIKLRSVRAKYAILATYICMNVLIFWVIIFHEEKLPDMFIIGSGMTPFKIGCERFITALQILAAFRFYMLARDSEDESLPLIFSAASVAVLSEMFLTQYGTSNDAQNFMGHLLKIVSYLLLYRAMFVVSVRRPYERLDRQTRSLMNASETLRIQALALESSTNPIMVADLEGAVQWSNHASRELAATLALSKTNNFSLFCAPLTPDPKMAYEMQATLIVGKVWRGQVVMFDGQNEALVLDRVVSPLLNENGIIEGYVSVDENVTDRIYAQFRHKRVIESALDGFWVMDRAGCLLEVNDAYAKLSGYTVDELLTMTLFQLETPYKEEAILKHLAKVTIVGHAQFETRHRHKLGYEYPIEISVTFERELKQFFVFLRDRSERELSATAQRTLKLQLQHSQKVQALGELTSGIAHDFNNILAAILGYSNLALDRYVPEKEGKLASYLYEVISAGERARDLIARMLVFARSQPSVNVQLISPANVICEVMSLVKHSIPSSMQLTHSIECGSMIRMDAGELNQVLINLIINARDAIGEYGTIRIRMYNTEINGQFCAASQQIVSGVFLALEVSDNGQGIAPEHISRLFDPFFTTKVVGKGTGLGLSMTQGILRRSDGYILVDSTLGLGSRFLLLFPIVSTAEAPVFAQRTILEAEPGLDKCIWVLDDEVAITRYLGDLLENAGYRVRLFYDPVVLLSELEERDCDIDLLITDQTMPGLSGLDLAIHVHGFMPKFPIILCTGFSDGLGDSLVFGRSFCRVFNKPVAADDLLKAVAAELTMQKI